MGILDDLLGGGQAQKDYKDFVDRYEQGNPSEGYSDQEVLKRYGEVSHSVPSSEYAQAAQDALGKLSPEERAEFLEMLRERAAERGVKLPERLHPIRKTSEKYSPIYMRSRVNFGISSAVEVSANLKRKRQRQGRTRSPTCCRPRGG